MGPLAPWLPPLSYGNSRGMTLSATTTTGGSHHHKAYEKGGLGSSQEDRKRLKDLSAHNIGMYTEQKTVSGLAWGHTTIKVARRHTVQRFDLDYFAGYGRPYGEAVFRRYLVDNAKPLWWSAKLVAGPTPVVRNKGSSRMNVAFREALREAGYDVQGWRVGEPVDGQQTKAQPWRRHIVQLYGSVEIAAHNLGELNNTKFSTLKARFAKVVKGLEEELGRTANGEFAAPSQAKSTWKKPDRGKPQGGSDRQRSSRPGGRPAPRRQ